MHPQIKLPTIFGLCVGGLKSITRKLSELPELLTKYKGILKEQMSIGISEEVKDSGESDGPVH